MAEIYEDCCKAPVEFNVILARKELNYFVREEYGKKKGYSTKNFTHFMFSKRSEFYCEQ